MQNYKKYCKFANIMNRQNIIIRQATIDDAKLIAYAVGTAIGEELMQEHFGANWIDIIAEISCLDVSQYSYRNTLVAEINDTPAGVIVAYDGARLDELRTQTLRVIHQYNPDFTFSEDETEVGEYYIDTLCVLPQYRKRGIATCLITSLCEKVFAEGKNCVGLIVDFDNLDAERLYTSLDFKRIKTRIFLGHQMWHLQKTR